MIIDDNTAEIFKIYDELTQKYSNEINGYREIIKYVDMMIQQKEKDIQDIKDKTLGLMKQAMSYPAITVPQEADLIIEYEKADADIEVVETQEFYVEVSAPDKEAPSPKKRKQARTKLSLKDLAAGKTEPETKAPSYKKTEKQVRDKSDKCLYHPDAQLADKQRQLCSACKWKLITNGLLNHDKDPDVITFLKGETNIVPYKGQQMCPIHPGVPAYNKKTGLCQKCQSKARSIGIKDRPLTDEELEMVRNSVIYIDSHL
jgi:hypothetical protein